MSPHAHRDHFDTRVLNWSEKYRNIHFIFAKEVKKKLGASMLRRMGFGEEIQQKITYVRPGQAYEVAGVSVETLLSTDSGVAFLVTVAGRTIYHAGDLNWWRWEGETEEFNSSQERNYKRQIAHLKDRTIDVSFVVVDPRQEEDRFLGIDYFLQQVGSGYVVPMHLWKQYDLVKEYRERPENESFRERILVFDEENQAVVLVGKTVARSIII